MKPAPAKSTDPGVLEELGRATLQIVHDLKNQLNGLKLYATFLRKRLESADRSVEERETLAKLIAGLDRAAKDMTALLRYAQPLELHPQPRIDLRKIISSVVAEAAARDTGGLPRVTITADIENEPMVGDFDPAALTEAIKAVTDDVRAAVPAKEMNDVSLNARRVIGTGAPNVLIEWNGVRLNARNNPFRSSIGCGRVHTALAARIIEAHGGQLKCDNGTIRAWLPLSTDH
jgi:nitrogen fixation/metabolism regulation signal transduction histidine kinase